LTKNKKILILVLSSNGFIHSINRFFQKITWVKNSSPNVQVVFYMGGYKSEYLKGDTLYLRTKTDFQSVGLKTLEAFEWSYNNLNFDLIFRTNASSYIHIPSLIKYAEENFTQTIYAGVEGKQMYFEKQFIFASGAGYIISRNIAKLIIDNKKEWNHKLLDDVALGDLLTKNKISLKIFNRNDVNVFPLIKDYDFKLFLTRCKLNHYNLPRTLEGLVMMQINKNYKKYKMGTLKEDLYEKVFFNIFRLIQKIYPGKFFSKYKYREYRKYLRDNIE
jgi:hypothetical protein